MTEMTVAAESYGKRTMETASANSISQILKTLIGQVITIINPTSYIPTLTGYRIDAETYKAKVISVEDGTLKVLIEFISDPHKKTKEKALQFIPVGQIRQVQVSETNRFVML